MSPVAASLPVALIEAPEPLRSGAFHRLVNSLWSPSAADAGQGELAAAAAAYAPGLVEALVERRVPDLHRVALLLGLLAEAEREADPTAVGSVRQCVLAAVPQLVGLLREAASDDTPASEAREALLYLAGQCPEAAAVLGAAVREAFGPESSAARALQGAFALASAQPRRARAILAYLGAEATHRAGPDREALLQRVLACPQCGGSVRLEPAAITCVQCQQPYAWQGDVPSLLRPADAVADQFPAARVAEYETGTRPRFVRVMSGDFDGVLTPEREADYLRQWLRPREGPVLDLACGAGGWTQAVASVAGADRVIALDYSLAMLEAVGVRVPRVTRVHGSASALPFRDGVLGGINCSDALQALPDPAAAVREVARTLMRGATFTCFTMLDAPAPYGYFQARFPDHARTRFSVAGLETLVRTAGLELVDLVTVGSGVFCAARKVA